MTPAATALFVLRPEPDEPGGHAARQMPARDSAPAAHVFPEVVRAFVKAGVATVDQDLEQLRQDLEAGRARLAAMAEQLEGEKAARLQAEAALHEARSVTRQIAAHYDTQVHALKSAHDAARAELGAMQQQLAAERAARTRVGSALDTLQQALDALRFIITPPAPEVTSERAAPSAAARPRTVTTPVAGPPPRHGLLASDPEQVAFVQRLLEEAVTMYASDQEAGLAPIESVDRLTDNLLRVRQSTERQFPEPEGAAAALFHQELTALLDAKGETAFGRHLSIAAHACTVSFRQARMKSAAPA